MKISNLEVPTYNAMADGTYDVMRVLFAVCSNLFFECVYVLILIAVGLFLSEYVHSDICHVFCAEEMVTYVNKITLMQLCFALSDDEQYLLWPNPA